MMPPIDRHEAGRILGRDVSPAAWEAVEEAFERYGYRLDNLAASKASRKKDDPQSWHARQMQAAKSLEAALRTAQGARDRHGRFLDEASDNYSLQTRGYSAGTDMQARRMVDDACRALLRALVIIERAEPIEVETPTAATARDDLLRDSAAALAADGIEVAASDGWRLDGLGRPARLSDLTAFEKLVAALGIGDEKRPAAFAAWVRGALGGYRG
jgi:hypothetical protein